MVELAKYLELKKVNTNVKNCAGEKEQRQTPRWMNAFAVRDDVLTWQL
jgi:hypothetical protein